MKRRIPCPNCKTEGIVNIEENLWKEKRYVLGCRCGSVSTSKDGIHWLIIIQNNNLKDGGTLPH